MSIDYPGLTESAAHGAAPCNLDTDAVGDDRRIGNYLTFREGRCVEVSNKPPFYAGRLAMYNRHIKTFNLGDPAQKVLLAPTTCLPSPYCRYEFDDCLLAITDQEDIDERRHGRRIHSGRSTGYDERHRLFRLHSVEGLQR